MQSLVQKVADNSGSANSGSQRSQTDSRPGMLVPKNPTGHKKSLKQKRPHGGRIRLWRTAVNWLPTLSHAEKNFRELWERSAEAGRKGRRSPAP